MTTTTFIPEFRVKALTDAVAKLNKRARRLGLAEIVLTQTGNRELRDFTVTDVFQGDQGTLERSRTEKVFAVEVSVTGESPKLDGWQFVATIDRIEETNVNVLCVSPSFKDAVPQRFRNCTSECDHCRKDRVRNNTFVLRHDSGEWVQVGRQCLKDFVGHADIHILTDAASFFSAFNDILEDCSEFSGSWGGKSAKVHDLTTVLVWARYFVEAYGWVSAATAQDLGKDSTGSAVRTKLTYGGDLAASEAASDVRNAAAMAEVGKVIDWARTLSTADPIDYIANLAAVFTADFVGDKHIGIAVSAIIAHRRHLEKLEAAAREAANPRLNEHFGTVGERTELTLTITGVRDIVSDFRNSTLVTLEDSARRTFKWFASGAGYGEADKGRTVTVKATIKKHDEYQGQLQTMLTRVSEVQPKRKFDKSGRCVDCVADGTATVVLKAKADLFVSTVVSHEGASYVVSHVIAAQHLPRGIRIVTCNVTKLAPAL